MDDGFTEHSGCPVVEGEKKIVTQWVWLGVNEENPWSSLNTLGVRVLGIRMQRINEIDVEMCAVR